MSLHSTCLTVNIYPRMLPARLETAVSARAALAPLFSAAALSGFRTLRTRRCQISIGHWGPPHAPCWPPVNSVSINSNKNKKTTPNQSPNPAAPTTPVRAVALRLARKHE